MSERVQERARVERMGRSAAWMVMITAALLLPNMGSSCVIETEPNDTTGTANLIRTGEIGQGNIDPVADVDVWRATGADIGDLVFAYVDTQDSTTSDDSFLEVLAADTTLIEDDDNDGPGDGSVVAGAIVPQSGNVFFQITEDGDNAILEDYDLFQAIVDPANTAAEVESNNGPGMANGISAVIMTGDVVDGSGDEDFFKFRATNFASLVVIMDDDPDDNGNETDTELDILDTDGSTVLAGGDDLSSNDGNAAGAVDAPSEGTYFVQVGKGLNSDSDYSFVLLVNGVPYSDSDGDLFADTDDNCPATNNAEVSVGTGGTFGASETINNIGTGCGAATPCLSGQTDAIITIHVLTDNFPSETTIEIAEQGGAVIFSAGPLVDAHAMHVFEVPVCSTSCYDFTISDSFGDGICCAWGPGSYEVFYNPSQVDGDGDGVGDSCDNCPASIFKSAGPGDCGCDQPDVDINGDGVSDCGLADPALSLLSSVGLLLVADADNNRIMAFDPADGDLVDPNFIPADAVNLPNPIAAILGPNQNTVLVSDANADVVQQYDLNGNYLGIFAPAGGVDTNILDGPSGLAWRPNGNLVVGVTNGTNDNAVAEFDTSGSFVGNFIDPGVGGLFNPRDILFHSNGQVLVSDEDQAIHAYDATGVFVSDFATNPGSLNLQLAEASNTNVYASAVLGERRGILDFLANGTLLTRKAPFSISSFAGLAELSNGNWMITGTPLSTDGGEGAAFEMDTLGNVVRTTLRGPNLGSVEPVLRDADGDGIGDALDGCPDDPNKTSPGACGCGTADTDSDGDGVADCNDPCPADNPDDSDGDGVCDSADVCPGADDTVDANGNGTPDCLDPAPAPPPAAQPAQDCCGGGMPMMMPLMLMGWKWRRGRSKRRRSSRRH